MEGYSGWVGGWVGGYLAGDLSLRVGQVPTHVLPIHFLVSCFQLFTVRNEAPGFGLTRANFNF